MTYGNGVRAVDDVDIDIEPGETFGLVGESGCGKSTTAKVILRLEAGEAETMRFEDADLMAAKGAELRRLRARLQVVPQHPATSLNPRLRVSESIVFNLRAHDWSRADRAPRVAELLDRVGLATQQGRSYPHELSGGQLQRAAIARALATNPRLVICDEAVSALDKSIQAQVLNLLVELQRDLGVAYLFISHDLSVVEHVSDRVAVMYLGRVVEEGPAGELWARPLHPYTQALLSAEPGQGRERIVLQGDPPSPSDPPSGCTFRTRCAYATDVCAGDRPPLVEITPGHRVACVLHPHPEALTA
jgi:peptide/nickel transport system ATP-binding protein/oligopeptide transport system ATP-binding protein